MIDPSDSDEELMQAYAAGDAGAFDRLFERHRRPLFTFLLHHTGDRARSEDLLQEVFLRIVRQRGSYRSRGSFRGWLFTMTRNALTDDRRRASVRTDHDAESPTAGDAPPPSGAWSDPVARSEARDLGGRLTDALLHLPEEQREVFLLRERGGLEYAEIASVTGVGVPTARSRMRYALEELRRRLTTVAAPFLESPDE